MSDIYRDDYHAGAEDAPLVPASVTRAAGAAVFLVLVAGMAFWAYRLGTRDAAEVPIIRAMEGPARIQPEDPGGLRAAHQGLEVNSVLAGAPAAPPAREAAPRPAPPPVTLAEEDGPQGELVIAVPEVAAVPAPAEGEELRMPLQEDGPEIALPLLPAEEPAPEALAAGDEPDAEAEAAGTRPRGRPAGLVVRPAPPAAPPAQAQAAQPAPAPAAPAPAAAAAREAAGLPSGTRLVQLGAFDNELLARQVWDQLLGRHRDLLGGKSLYVERATSNARVFYRLRVAGFQSAEQTRVMCESLRARGVDCIPVTLQ